MTDPYLVKHIVVKGRKIMVTAESRFARKYLHGDFYVEYSEDIGLNESEQDILLTPFLLNVAPVVWISGKSLRLESMDADLYQSLKNIRKVFRILYPNHRWDGEIHPDRLITGAERGLTNDESNGVLVFFSGGVDSLFTSLKYQDAAQTLISVRGLIDTPLNAKRKWCEIQSICNTWAARAGHQTIYVKGNIMDIIKKKTIRPDIPLWWANIQFGLGLAGLAIPALIGCKKKSVLVSSAHTKDTMPYAEGSRPDLEGQLRFAGRSVIHYGFDTTRQEKVAYIVEHFRKTGEAPPRLNVCFRPYAGQVNCCECEKCVRTITALILEGAILQDYGFYITNDKAVGMVKQKIGRYTLAISQTGISMWREMVCKASELLDITDSGGMPIDRDFLQWIVGIDFDTYQQEYMRRNALNLRLKQELNRFPAVHDFARKLVERLKGSLRLKKIL